MKFTNMKALNDVVLDYSNPFKMYALAREYDKLEQGAAAFGWYLRAADFCEGETFEEKWLQYKAIIMGAKVMERNGDRAHTVVGMLKMAIGILPTRPEAYYFLSKLCKERHEWRDALIYSKIAIDHEDSDDPEWAYENIDNDLEFPGINAIKFIHAVSKWKSDGRDDSKNLLFDLKWKEKLDEKLEKEVNGVLTQVGYPSTLAYNKNEKDNFRYQFDGIETIKKNYSRHFQDMFVISLLNGKREGTFVEIGSGHPVLFNNTLMLENDFDWKGISIDTSERMCAEHSRKRKSTVINEDASKIDYKSLFKQNCLENNIDFLRINAEQASLQALDNMPFHDYEFTVIQFQHNACWWGDDFRNKSREILNKIGYVLYVPNVAVDETNAYEDWWVHPGFVNNRSPMFANARKEINFAWTYMMKGK